MNDWNPPPGHPISMEKAKELLAGDLGKAYRDILAKCCAPIYWFDRKRTDKRILGNGTVTLVKTPEALLGVTAAHVLRGYWCDCKKADLELRVFDAPFPDLDERVIDVSDKLDLATFRLNVADLAALGKESQPLADWPPRAPDVGRGIMLAGFPAVERREIDQGVEFGLFTSIAVARSVTDLQITWLIEPEAQLANAGVPPPPPQYGLGGVSGGPLITWLETPNHIATFALGGVIIEHPDYDENDFSVERVVAVRGDLVNPSGRIHG